MYKKILVILFFLFWAFPALADSVFTIEDPPVDFEVVDADPFDGIGDNGPYSTFNDALLGTEGECRSMAEFDISPFSVPPGEFISAATFEVRITAIEIYGLGVNGETPESLAVDGYVGNGIAELSDFEAGDGNILDWVATPDPQIGQVLSFDVTAFVTDLVNAEESFVGLTVRAETFGGLWVTEGSGFPKLTIETGWCGDVNNDGVINSADVVYLINYLFKGGPAPDPIQAGDVNLDGVLNSADVVYLINYLFKGGPPPCS
ncbi:hypothetical protein AMJ44_08540 [candidate division WOR-1 bacterium DG_54_3]|uniref:Dockerin domain-containing protein n=1 Tax=candidate division WOR-1 bacterium DG_54_3 TaxID=1703775 RepID=A0A0S7XW98_UNCSA|nr:MAG: hypothetical protein AMJ44_08540 [candidate division WOR-1 bacterium DG_54_3]